MRTPSPRGCVDNTLPVWPRPPPLHRRKTLGKFGLGLYIPRAIGPNVYLDDYRNVGVSAHHDFVYYY